MASSSLRSLERQTLEALALLRSILLLIRVASVAARGQVRHQENETGDQQAHGHQESALRA